MFNTKKSLIAALVAGALALGAKTSIAETITVSNGAAPTVVASGPYSGDTAFSYSISFSPTTNVQTNDGFLIADFGPLAFVSSSNPGYSLTAGTGNAPSASSFTEAAPLGGGTVKTGLAPTDEVVPSLIAGDDEFLNSSAPEFIVDSATVADVMFTYSGSGFVGNGTTPGTLSLTLYTTEQFVNSFGYSIGVDQSGSGNAFAADPNTVAVPSPTAVKTPLPASSIGGGLLIAMLAAAKLRKARLLA